MMISNNRPVTRDQYDLIVIGGGCNGTGIAADAAKRGLKVCLVEKGGLSQGTTAYSSRLIHGGLRYLAEGDIGLVKESLTERQHLLENAPHLVRPLALGLPVYKVKKEDQDAQEGMGFIKRFMNRAKKNKLAIKLAMTGYDLLSRGKSMPKHDMMGKKEFLENFPGISEDGLKGGAMYYDCQMTFPERLCIENAMVAQETGNADIKTHTRVDGLLTEVVNENRQAAGVEVTDVLTGEKYGIKAKAVINVAGPWVDDIAKLAAKPEAVKNTETVTGVKKRIGGSRGSHIVVKQWEGGPGKAMALIASDGRQFFIIPWQKDFYLIGTTEEPHEDMNKIVAEKDEVDYLLSEANQIFKPSVTLKKDDVLFTYAGVRALPYAGDDADLGSVSREYTIENHADDKDHPLPHLFSLIGGKLTTFRNLAETTVDHVVKELGMTLDNGNKVPESSTLKSPLPGGESVDNFETFKQEAIQSAKADQNIPEDVTEHLVNLYGARYKAVLNTAKLDPSLLERLHPSSPNIKAQVVYAVTNEFAQTAMDVLRSMGANWDEDSGLNEIEPVAKQLQQLLGWDDARTQQEVTDYKAFVDSHHFGFKQ